jgi:D-alanyl-lipoteichoic acid acyltransferase DltB (MBOAT superfamily)
MLFNSHLFLFAFLPVTLLGFFAFGRRREWAGIWLALASLFFYGYWNIAYIPLLLASIAVNYAFGVSIGRGSKRLLPLGILFNLILLGYYKYAHFFLENIDQLTGAGWQIGKIVLPLGISFFTFTQIAYLMDVYREEAKEYSFAHYLLFVTYFPHLIAGPILHHKEMMPQFSHPETYRPRFENFSVGTTIFFAGLFKKVILADGIAGYVAPVFGAHASGVDPSFVDAWCGALAYTCQLYFDFSAYSDMAVGVSRLFGITLPVNFYSPYQAVNIIEFWRRWHMTLSRFLRDYLYFPLGGNRKGKFRRYANLMATMLLGGLWHGAGWTFVIWGALHGIYLCINHGWIAFKEKLSIPSFGLLDRLFGRILTFLAVVIGWVFFRADSLDSALSVLRGMMGLNGFVIPDFWMPKWGIFGQWLASRGAHFGTTATPVTGGEINWIWILLAIALFAPNLYRIMGNFRPALNLPQEQASKIAWKPSLGWVLPVAMLGFFSIVMMEKASVFLYFQF